MSEETARTVLYAMTSVGAILWLSGLATLRMASREGHAVEAPDPDRFGPDEPRESGNVLVGAEVVEGTPAELSRRAAACLASEGAGWLGPIRVRERTDERVRFEALPGPAWNALRGGALRFEADSPSRTRVSYRAEIGGGRWLLVAGVLVQALGLVALFVGFWLARTYAVQAADLAARSQVIQMVQVVHFLWPPFLFAALYRGRRRTVRAVLDALVSNLPYRELRPFQSRGPEVVS